MIQLCASGHSCQKQRHAIVFQATSPLSYRGVARIEDVFRIADCGRTDKGLTNKKSDNKEMGVLRCILIRLRTSVKTN